MKVSLIPSLNMNRWKSQNEPQVNYRYMSKPAVSDVFVKNTAPLALNQVSFGGTYLLQSKGVLKYLSNMYGIVDPYSGKTMIPSTVSEHLNKARANLSPKGFSDEIINAFSNSQNRECISNVDNLVVDRVLSVRAQNPELDVFEILQCLRAKSLNRILDREFKILRLVDVLADKHLPDNYTRKDIHFLTQNASTILNEGVSNNGASTSIISDDTFRRKIVIKKMNDIIKHSKNPQLPIFVKMMKLVNHLPSSSTNPDSFIVKYSRVVKPADAIGQEDLLQKIAMFEVPTKLASSYSKVLKDALPYIEELKKSVFISQGYLDNKLKLLNYIYNINKNDISPQIRNTLITQIKELPDTFASYENDLKLRMNAISSRVIGEVSMSVDHLVPKSTTKLKNIPKECKEQLESQINSLGNYLLASRGKNTEKESISFYDYIKQDSKIKTNYFPAYFKSLFKIAEKTETRQEKNNLLYYISEQIKTVEQLSKGEIKIGKN